MTIVFLGFKVGFYIAVVCAGIAAVRSAYFMLDGHYELAGQEFMAIGVFAILGWWFNHKLQKMV